MKKYMRKMLSFVLILALVLSLVHLCDVMEVYAETEGDWRYEIRAGEVEITGYDGSDKEVVIPNSIGGKSVTSIGEYAFWGCSGLKSITIPKSVKSIGNRAFELCVSLKRITIPSSVKSIGNGAFSFCNGLKSITIPKSVKSIGNGAFSFCSPKLVFRCSKGSYAAKYANANNIKVKFI